MSYNLIRNARVFFTTNVGTTTGVVPTTGFLANNTREIQVLDGMSFSQNTTTETVTLNEAGLAPVRGQRQFNTALDPVDFSFTTYMRPQDGGTNITAEESVLWNAMFAVDPIIDGANPAWTDNATYGQCVATNSEKHQLQKFGLIIVLDTTTFIIDDCVLNTATVDFGLDAIASIQWAGQGRYLRQITTPTFVDADTWSGTLTGDYKTKNTTAPYIANKLSVLELNSGFTSGQAYTIALTGGSLSISNNVTYLVPANLGVVNQPATYFTGTRSITGTLNCYLRTGTLNSAGLIDTLLTGSTTEVNPVFRMNIKVGGGGANRVEFNMPSVVLSIPSVNTEQVVSTAITFTAQGSANNLFDIATANELNVKYYTTNVAGV